MVQARSLGTVLRQGRGHFHPAAVLVTSQLAQRVHLGHHRLQHARAAAAAPHRHHLDCEARRRVDARLAGLRLHHHAVGALAQSGAQLQHWHLVQRAEAEVVVALVAVKTEAEVQEEAQEEIGGL